MHGPPLSLRDWHRTMLGRSLFTLGLAIAISLVLTVVRHGGFFDNLVYSLAIGGLCELTLDGGRWLVARILFARSPGNVQAGQGWPGWGWMGVCIAVGVPLAYVGGHAIGDWFTGDRSSLGNGRPSAGMLTVSLTLGLAATRAEAEAAQRIAAEHRLKLLESQLDLPPELAHLPVPALLLQPLVENAIRHGLEPALDGGLVRVEARRVEHPGGARLQLRVFDSGKGPTSACSPPSGTGFGLTQVRERLRTLYGQDATLALRRIDGDHAAPGTLALLELPLPPADTP